MLSEAAVRLWAKRSKTDDSVHPLACHLLDVANVVQALWDAALAAGLKADLAEGMGCDEGRARAQFALLAGLHDLGKASPRFQQQDGPSARRLAAAGLGFRLSDKEPHGVITAHVVCQWLKAGALGEAWHAQDAWGVAAAVGGHHGVFVSSGQVGHIGSRVLGDAAWNASRWELAEWLTSELSTREETALVPFAPTGAFIMLLAGLTTVADWIASNEGSFDHDCADLGAYPERSRERASEALAKLAFHCAPPQEAAPPFSALFPGLAPRDMQQRAADRSRSADEPFLVLIEAPMGGGKTEAALYAAQQQLARLGGQGFYVALPTMATANAMFGRVRPFVERLAGDQQVNLHLLHGQALLSEGYAELQEAAIYDERPGDRERPGEGGVVAASWFTQRKRPLLAPFGVGTVDQALLSVLQTRHAFVRLFGLARKTIIFDEVHAYDTYMSTLFEHLLRWLAALRCSAVVLSATLPSARRRALVGAYLGGQADPHERVPYPRLTWASGSRHEVIGLDKGPPRRLRLERVSRDAGELGRRLGEALAGGGCAAVICNTVQRAQKLYRAWEATILGPHLDLFHARFAAGERRKRECRTVEQFGPGDEHRPHKAVLIATQVVEQSLDLDFDLMVSDLAPADLLLQRAGRLHRHARDSRPGALREPALWIAEPDLGEDGVPRFGDDEYVYEPAVLLRTWAALEGRGELAQV